MYCGAGASGAPAPRLTGPCERCSQSRIAIELPLGLAERVLDLPLRLVQLPLALHAGVPGGPPGRVLPLPLPGLGLPLDRVLRPWIGEIPVLSRVRHMLRLI